VTLPGRPSGSGFALLAMLVLLPVAFLPVEAFSQSSGHLLIHPRPNDAVVAVSVRFPSGSEADPADLDGAAFLLGLLLEEEANRRVAEFSARVSAEVSRSEFTFTMVAPAEEWVMAWRRVVDLLDSGPLPENAVAAARERQRNRLIFETGAPGRAFDLEAARYLYGTTHPSARPVAGSLDALERMDRTALEDARRQILDWGDAVVGVVGAVTQEEAGAVFEAAPRVVGIPMPAATAPPPGEADTVAPAAPPSAVPAPRVIMEERSPPLRISGAGSTDLAWGAGDRRVIDRDVTSTWIMVAWPIPSGTPLVLEDFLVHLVREALNPTPPDPGVYSAAVAVEVLNGSPLLVVRAGVDPRQAYAWEERILATVEGVAIDPPQGAFFELARRRFRATTLLEHAIPESRALWMVRTFAARGDVPRIPAQVWGLTREGVSELAGARGEPRILLFGPTSVMGR
jgi:hypothetical protein